MQVDLHGTKLTKREKRSTTVKIPSKPRTVRGNGIIKSIVTCSKHELGLGKGYKSPYGF